MWVDKDRTSSTRKSLIRSLTWVLLFIVCNFSNLISVTRAVYQPNSSAYVITDVHFCCTSLFCAFMNTWPLLWHHCLRYVETDMHSWHISQCIYSIHMSIFAASSTYTMLPWSKYNRFDKISIRVGRWICEAWQRSTRYQGWTKRHQVARSIFFIFAWITISNVSIPVANTCHVSIIEGSINATVSRDWVARIPYRDRRKDRQREGHFATAYTSLCIALCGFAVRMKTTVIILFDVLDLIVLFAYCLIANIALLKLFSTTCCRFISRCLICQVCGVKSCFVVVLYWQQ